MLLGRRFFSFPYSFFRRFLFYHLRLFLSYSSGWIFHIVWPEDDSTKSTETKRKTGAPWRLKGVTWWMLFCVVVVLRNGWWGVGDDDEKEEWGMKRMPQLLGASYWYS